MKKIIEVLMDYGMDFEYEHRGFHGEKVVSYELGLEIYNQNGNIYFSCMSVPEKVEESEGEYDRLALEIEKECISQTASF